METDKWQDILANFQGEGKFIRDNISRISPNAAEWERCSKRILGICERAGELFYEELAEIEAQGLTISSDFTIKPIYRNPKNNYLHTFYAKYWLACLGELLPQQHKVDVNFSKMQLPRYKYPQSTTSTVDWGPYSYSPHQKDMREFLQLAPYLLKQLCQYSIKLCEIILGTNPIKPSDAQSGGISVKDTSPRVPEDRIALSIDPSTQTIIYGERRIPVGGSENWELFEKLYRAKGGTVKYQDIADDPLRAQGKMLELKKVLKRENAQPLVAAIKNQRSVGYYLDFTAL